MELRLLRKEMLGTRLINHLFDVSDFSCQKEEKQDFTKIYSFIYTMFNYSNPLENFLFPGLNESVLIHHLKMAWISIYLQFLL